MSAFTIQAQPRGALGKKTKALRKSGTLPAVLYGHGVASRPLTVRGNDFLRVYRAAGASTLVNLVVDGEPPVKVIIQDVQRHPVSGQPLHVDLHQVRMTEKIHADIPLKFSGEAPAVKELGGVFLKNLDHLKVEALPGDLIHEIVVDVAKLKTFADMIHVRDVVMPPGITALDKAEEVVCLVTEPRSEQELAELETTVEEKVEEVEGVKKEEVAAEAKVEAVEPAPAPAKEQGDGKKE